MRTIINNCTSLMHNWGLNKSTCANNIQWNTNPIVSYVFYFHISLKVYMKWNLSLSYWNKGTPSIVFPYRSSFLWFAWYVNNTLHTSHCIRSCWETMYMIEIILLNQSKLSLLGVIRQIPLHAQFRVTLFDNFNDISTFTTHYAVWRMQGVVCISNKP